MLTDLSNTPTLRLRLLPDSHSFLNLQRVTLTFGRPIAEHVRQGTVRATLTDLDGSTRVIDDLHVSTSGRQAVIEFDDVALWTPVDEQLNLRAAEWILDLQCSTLDKEQWQTPGFLTDCEVSLGNSVSGETMAPANTIVAPLVYEFEGGDSSPVARPVPEFVAESGLPFIQGKELLVLPKGEHVVSHDLTIPANHGLRLEAGTVLKMGPGVSVVCYGPLTVAGTSAEPVRIIPLYEDAPWGSFAVVRAGEVSRVQYLEVKGGSERHLNGLYLSGQLCFYWSDVELEHCKVHEARADDGLNVKKSRMLVRHCSFSNNAFDALDADWVRGSVESCVFRNNGGDGLDFSGSQVMIRDCLFQTMADKALSVGEKSDVLVFNCVIRDCEIGVASKDLSKAALYASAFYRNNTAVALYRKKQVFGGASGKAVGCLFWNNGTNVSADAESEFDALEIGADHWEATDGVTANALHRKPPHLYYAIDKHGSIKHSPSLLEASPFRITVATGEFSFGGVPIPELIGHPVGLIRPLDLEPAW